MTEFTIPSSVGDMRMYIGGEWTPGSDGTTFTSINPSNETEVARIPDATAADVDRAADAAHAAAAGWKATTPGRRAELLYEIADIVKKNMQELATIDTVETGNPINASLDDVRSTVRDIRMFAGFGTELKAHSVTNGRTQFSYGLLEPCGVVGRITAYNHPFKYAAGKAAAMLIGGNTAILKPSEHASLSTLRFAELVHGLIPPGVLSVVTGRGESAGAFLAAHPRIPRVAFTGGLAAGRAVLHAGAEHIKHITMELGGKNPMIVFPDVSPADAANAAVRGMNFARSQGQSCQSTSRVFVHTKIYTEFISALIGKLEDIRVGDPLETSTQMGPLAYRDHFSRVLAFIEGAKRQGANLVSGGEPLEGVGLYMPPTAFADVDHSMTIAREEIFGPVVAVIPWNDYDSVIEQANDLSYGLTANIWTNDLDVAHRTAHALQAGYVWVNGTGSRVPGTPFGGYKQSGLGKESCLAEVLSYCEEKVIAVSLKDSPTLSATALSNSRS